MLSSMLPMLQEDAYAYSNCGKLLSHTVYPYYEVAIVGDDAQRMLLDLSNQNVPNILLVGSTRKSDIALFEDRYFNDATYVYVCQDNACKLPVKTIKEALPLLGFNEISIFNPLELNPLN